MNPNELLSTLSWRYAVKKFDATRKVDAALWSVLEKALVLSPSSYGLQPWKFIVVQTPSLKQSLRAHSWNQSQVEDCSHLVVLAANKKVTEADVSAYVSLMAEIRNIPLQSLEVYKNMMVGDVVHGPRSKVADEWAARQVYIALGNLMTSAAILGIDTCPMEGIEPSKYDEILGLAGTQYQTICACAIGYRHVDDALATQKKVRFKSTDLISYQ